MNEPIIHVKGFKKEFGPKIVLNKVDLKINKGEIFGIVGMSGSGKTTLLNSLIGFVAPEEGDVLFRHDGEFKSVYKSPMEVNKIFGFASQQPSVYPKLTAEENLEHFGSLYDVPFKVRKENTNNLLKMVGLDDSRHRLAKNLSGGMQKRLSIACALIHDPKILILDEPTSDLDPILRKQAWDIIQRINGYGTTVVVASHFLEEIEQFCHNLAILHNTEIISTGSPDELRNKYSKDYEIHLETADAKYDDFINKLRNLSSLIKFEQKDHKLIVYSPSPEKILLHMLHTIGHSKLELVDLFVNKPRLNEVFESLTRGKHAKDS